MIEGGRNINIYNYMFNFVYNWARRHQRRIAVRFD